MMRLVNTGPDELGGSLYVIKKYDDSMFDLKFAGSLSTIASQLKVGDIVERMLQNGDLVRVYCIGCFTISNYNVYSHRSR